jgi:hypothetical protein
MPALNCPLRDSLPVIFERSREGFGSPLFAAHTIPAKPVADTLIPQRVEQAEEIFSLIRRRPKKFLHHFPGFARRNFGRVSGPSFE